MSLSEIEELKKENARLRKVIILLLEKDELEMNTSSPTTSLDGKESISSSDRTGVYGKDVGSASYISGIDRKESDSSSQISEVYGENFNSPSHISNNYGEIGQDSVLNIPSIEVNQENITKLAETFSSRGRKSGKKNKAHLLLHFHSGQNGSNASIRHLVGMTESGVFKLVHQLKKEGLIVRKGMGKYQLTAKAQDRLSQVFR
ncbi:MAG: hypothetical protein IPP77_11910 [Bacteroidetes bacterium]|nr:hypothetical protein [Bacteroidota bacterium]